jgi:epoxyqueuosine reductase
LIYPLEKLKERGLVATGFYYNPNIHPFAEYTNRKQAVEGLGKSVACEIIYPEYDPAEFFREVNLKEANPGRCSACWGLRLKRTALEAKKRGFGDFSTTLLVSPYQDIESIRKIGEDAGREAGVNFYYEDFRPGFRKAHDEAKKKGIYCQKYCGCIYSEMERCRKSEKR